MDTSQIITQIVLSHYPSVQAIYLFGTHGTEYERADSDVDIALLFPPDTARGIGSLVLSSCEIDLVDRLCTPIDLINLRIVSTVFQMEIIRADRRIYCSDEFAADEFEMLTISYYQKLNEERKEIIKAFINDPRGWG